MSDYRAPIKDIMFALEMADLEAISQLPGLEHATPDMVEGILGEAARFMEEVVAPVNRSGDEHGSRVEGGGVVTAPGFKEAYAKYLEAGWAALPFPEQYGGGAFPQVVGLAVQELMQSASMAFSLGPLLTQGAIDALIEHGSGELQATYLPRMVSGEWAGTMNLTEPHAGSDLGHITSKAVPQGDGTYRITGQKIFITYGDHDLTENIVHLVLAKTPDAPPGTKGISMFVVPKFLVTDDGGVGERNGVTVVSVEHKLGIHGSPTCVMAFEGATGYLVGEEHQGMRYMFTMMNAARLSVGMQGLSISERAYQQALAYAHERKQGAEIGGTKGEMVPIVRHPDVRRMLITQRAFIQAMRFLMYENGALMDVARRSDDEATATAALRRAELLIPLSKAWSTDLGVELTSLAVQVHGGMGYVEETGVAQHWRDSRIAPIYEGTNGIQAMDLVGRKLPMDGGSVIRDFIGWIGGSADVAAEAGFDRMKSRLEEALSKVSEATMYFAGSAGDIKGALAGATPYLRLLAQVAGGAYMARAAAVAKAHLDEGIGDADHLTEQIALAEFYVDQLMPQVFGLVPAVTAGADPLYAIEL
jgi:alkylation response protein AidB-like acyl-CoA dehydrogenase